MLYYIAMSNTLISVSHQLFDFYFCGERFFGLMENHSIHSETFLLFVTCWTTWDDKQLWAPEYLQGILYEDEAAMVDFFIFFHDYAPPVVIQKLLKLYEALTCLVLIELYSCACASYLHSVFQAQ